MNLVDVFVTETSKPVYLALSAGGSIIWNVQAAEGVEISRIVVIGENGTGLAFDDPAVPVESVRCGPAAWKEPRPHWKMMEREENRPGALDPLRDNYRTYARWFKREFGVWDTHNLVEADQANHVLVGPVPEPDERIRYKSLDGREVRLAQAGPVFMSTPSAAKEAYIGLLKERVKNLVGSGSDSFYGN